MPLIPLKATVNPNSSGNSWTLTGKSVSASRGITALSSWFLEHARFCSCPPRVCFPSPVEALLIKSHWPSKSNFLGVLSPFAGIPQVGESTVALGTLQQCKNLFGIIVLQFVSCLLGCSMVGLMATSSRWTDAVPGISQICCIQSPCPHGRPLLTRASAEDTQTLKGGLVQSLSCIWFPVHTRFCLSPPSISGRYGSKCNFTPSLSC